ncbi:MAG: amidohydrolase [Anaerolineae bacterium]|jgi:amidohydrolase
MLERAQEIAERLVAWRRDFHMHPELGFEETRTAGRVAQTLEDLGYQVRTGVGKTGVVADRGQGAPVIAIRADMDALPIQEGNDVEYASQVPGVMHACGHDVHTAIGLGVATLLSKEAYPGTIRFLFQPAEEVADDEGISGAPRMIEDGAMEGVDAVFGLHVDVETDVGDVVVAAGPVSAGVDTLFATITGRGGHGAIPHKALDPIYLSAHVVMALYGIASRRLNPFEPAVISFGSIHGGQAGNVIPEEVQLSATIRYMEPEVQRAIHTEIERALNIAQALGGGYSYEIEIGYPPMYNDARISRLLAEVGDDLLGAGHNQPGEKHLGAEDFGFFSKIAPGAMFMLGCRLPGDQRRAHHPLFDVDERCMPIGAAILAEAALRLLRNEEQD